MKYRNKKGAWTLRIFAGGDKYFLGFFFKPNILVLKIVLFEFFKGRTFGFHAYPKKLPNYFPKPNISK